MVGARFQFAAALAFCLFGSAADAKGPPQSEERNVTLSPLERDVTALLREWEPLGRARRKKPFFSVQGEQSPLLLERSLLDPETPGCVTVSVLGAPNQSFLLHLSQATLSKARRAWPIPSLAGIAEITRCGARKPLLAGLAVRLHSRRGVLETTVLASEYPPPAAHELLSHRQAGATVSSPQLGSFPEQATLDQRLRHLERKAERDVASSTEKTEMTSGASGAAASIAQLPAGCHRMTLLARGKPAPPPVLRVEDLATGEGFHSSRGSGKGGSIFFCTARATRTRIVAVDAQPHSELLLYRASFDHSDAIPSHWGAHLRGALGTWSTRTPLFPTAPLRPGHKRNDAIGVRAPP